MAIPTEVWPVDPANLDPVTIARAAGLLRGGELVAFPTETVYGLGANALDENAVRMIFTAKGRPATNPVIVHVADAGQIPEVAANWPEAARKLAAAFWPGPLTIVVPKTPNLPAVVTAGGPTVAVRCPRHLVAAALIQAAGFPVAAPSANRSTELSPTRAEHVLKGLGGRIAAILDGGPCPGGIESTVVDATGDVVRLLRPGLVTVPMLEAVVGRIEPAGGEPQRPEEAARSPGQMERHYSPRTTVRLVVGNDILEDAIEAEHAGKRVATVEMSEEPRWVQGRSGIYLGMPRSPAEYAAALFARLHELDAAGLDVILIELPPDTPEWAAIRDRLTRAAAKPAPAPGE
jgi:L-threonylcarbamoyladenylate synthase